LFSSDTSLAIPLTSLAIPLTSLAIPLTSLAIPLTSLSFRLGGFDCMGSGEIDNKQEKTKEIGRDWGSGEQKKDIIRD
jgi:hypothetical protein